MSKYSLEDGWFLELECISLKLALIGLQAALEKANSLSAIVSIVVVNTAGHQICSAHMDNAPLQCQNIALRKAQTAVGFSMSTRAWEQRLGAMSDSVKQGLPLQPGLVLFGGGEPFLKNGTAIGAIGVSGSTEDIDQFCALSAVSAIAEKYK